jgi:hypothetical protein
VAYNGWSNYETWNVALWIDNEPGSYQARRELAKDAKDESDLARSLESWIKDDAPDLGASVYSDLLGAALSEVNWYEIAENYFNEAHEDCDEDCETCEERKAESNA